MSRGIVLKWPTNDKNQICLKHGIENAGESTFLINDKGIIVAINPEADEVQKILEEHLKNKKAWKAL